MSLKARSTTCVALLRGVNLGGNKMVPMADLRAMLTDLGFREPRTLLQSGNAVFGARTRAPAKLEGQLETALVKRMGINVDFFVRTAAQWKRVLAANPFTDAASDMPSHLLVFFLRRAPDAAAVRTLEAPIRGRERIHAVGAQLYVVYPDGQGRSKFTHTVVERHLGTRATGRNWNTVTKLAAMLGPG